MVGPVSLITPPAKHLADAEVAARILLSHHAPDPGTVSIDRYGRSSASPHVLKLNSPSPRATAVMRPRRAVRFFPVSSSYREAWRVGPHPVRYEASAAFRNISHAAGRVFNVPHQALEWYLGLVEKYALIAHRTWQQFSEARGTVSTAGERRRASPVARERAVPFRARLFARPAVVLGAVAVVVVLPLTGYQAVAGLRGSENALRADASRADTSLRAALQHIGRDPSAAAAAFAESEAAFRRTQVDLHDIGIIAKSLAALLPKAGAELDAAQAVSRAGVAASRAGERLARDLAAAGTDTNLVYKLAVLRNAALAALPEVTLALRALSALSPRAFSGARGAAIAAVREKVARAGAALGELPELADALSSFLGNAAPRRYLVIFQNSAELRPTGGFIGSFAAVTVRRGSLERIDIPAGGAYDLKGSTTALVLPPGPLRLVAGRWYFHDANWFPDFPTSARKLEWFYQKSGGGTPDGVIAVTSDALPGLLELLGPVKLPGGEEATSANVLELIRADIDARVASGEAPKQIIATLGPVLLDRLTALKGEKILSLGSFLKDALDRKRILVSVRDDSVARSFARRGWDGALRRAPTTDDLALVSANIGGEKTDAAITEEMEVDASVDRAGRIVNTVTIRRTHTARAGTPAGKRNIAYLRLYVPVGSQLLGAEGDFDAPADEAFEASDPAYSEDREVNAVEVQKGIEPESGTRVTEEFSRTVFGNWMQLLPGEVKTIQFRYLIPETLSLEPAGGFLVRMASGAPVSRWMLRVWAQPGAEHRTVRVTLRPPNGYGYAYATPSLESVTGEDPRTLSGDLLYGALLAPL